MWTSGVAEIAGQAELWAAPAGAGLFALLAGRRCERLAGAAVLLGLGTSAGVAPDAGWAALAVDAAVLASLTGVAVSCKPFWTLFAAAFQLLTALTRLLTLTSGGSAALDIALQAWGYALSAALVVGGWRACRERPAERRARLSRWSKVL